MKRDVFLCWSKKSLSVCSRSFSSVSMASASFDGSIADCRRVVTPVPFFFLKMPF